MKGFLKEKKKIRSVGCGEIEAKGQKEEERENIRIREGRICLIGTFCGEWLLEISNEDEERERRVVNFEKYIYIYFILSKF